MARVKFIIIKVIFRYHTKGISDQVSSYSDREIKSYSCSNSSTKVGKNEKSGRKFSGLQNGVIRRLQIGTGSREQIGARGVANTGSFRDSKSGQKDYKSGQKGFSSGQGL